MRRRAWTSRVPDMGYMGVMSDSETVAFWNRLHKSQLASERALAEKIRNYSPAQLNEVLQSLIGGGSGSSKSADEASKAAEIAGEEARKKQEAAQAAAEAFASEVSAAVTTKIADLDGIKTANSGTQKMLLMGVAGVAAFLFFRRRKR